MGNIFVIPYCHDENYKEDDIIIEIEHPDNMEIENREYVISFLNEKYGKNELCILRQPALGNCLFESLACPFKNPAKDHKEMRKELVEYIGKHTDLIRDYLAIDKVGSDNIQLVRHLENTFNTNKIENIIENF
jgi:hypothetical protein